LNATLGSTFEGHFQGQKDVTKNSILSSPLSSATDIKNMFARYVKKYRRPPLGDDVIIAY